MNAPTTNEDPGTHRPSFRIRYSERWIDEQGQYQFRKPVELGTVWPRRNGKAGGIVQWHLPLAHLKDGVFFLLDANPQSRDVQTRAESEKDYPTRRISFAEQRLDERGNTALGKPVEVATAWPRKDGKQGEIINWHISPQSLREGAFFVLDVERHQTREAQQNADPFAAIDARARNREQGRER